MMKILIVDDEQPARERLCDLLQELDADSELYQAANGKQALEAVSEHAPDIILLDIRMPIMDGLETAQHLSQLDAAPAIIFTTAYEEHALAAFDANAIDYLLKPIRPQRLQQSIKKAHILSPAVISQLAESTDLLRKRKNLSVASQGKIELIPIDDIIFFRAEQKYVSIFLKDREILTIESLKKLEQEFAQEFLRIHRNALVAIKFIQSMARDKDGNNAIKMCAIEQPLPISRRHLKAVKRKLKA